MIVKEKIARQQNSKTAKAGDKAEGQMAFYLRRAFADSPDVLVFNDLRLLRDGEVVQIDHLIVHRYGFVIVESKSVVEKMTVNAHGEFCRYYRGKPQGMQSPIKQAYLQAKLLSKILNDNKEQLRRKVFFGRKQGFFGEERFRVLVAISDCGIIERKDCNPPELMKADSIVDVIKCVIETHRNADGISGFFKAVTTRGEVSQKIQDDHLPGFTDDELQSLTKFLLDNDTPVELIVEAEIVEAHNHPAPSPVELPSGERLTTAPMAVQSPPNEKACKHCQSVKLEVVYGRYGYYFKCLDCEGNTPIKLKCSTCGEKEKLKKSGPNFNRVCATCKSDEPFHVNAT